MNIEARIARNKELIEYTGERVIHHHQIIQSNIDHFTEEAIKFEEVGAREPSMEALACLGRLMIFRQSGIDWRDKERC